MEKVSADLGRKKQRIVFIFILNAFDLENRTLDFHHGLFKDFMSMKCSTTHSKNRMNVTEN